MSKPNISGLEFYLVKVEEINKWDDNYEAYGISTYFNKAKEEAFGYLPRNNWNNVAKVWKYYEGEWYEQDTKEITQKYKDN